MFEAGSCPTLTTAHDGSPRATAGHGARDINVYVPFVRWRRIPIYERRRLVADGDKGTSTCGERHI